jgi:glycosidase
MTSNHDVRRIASVEGMTLEGSMLHHAFLFSVRGIPQLYYGDEIFMEGGEDPDNRRDFPGGFPGDARNAFEKSGRTAREQRMFEWVQEWIYLRMAYPAMRHGRLIDLASDEDMYAFARQTASETIIVAFNRSAKPKQVTAPSAFINVEFGTLLPLTKEAGAAGAIYSGTIRFEVPARTAVAFSVSDKFDR